MLAYRWVRASSRLMLQVGPAQRHGGRGHRDAGRLGIEFVVVAAWRRARRTTWASASLPHWHRSTRSSRRQEESAREQQRSGAGRGGANGRRHSLDVQWQAGSWWQPLQGQRFDLVLSNPPYIAAGDPHLAALRHEPLQALSPGGDGLSDLRHIVQGAPLHLQPDGWLLLEHGHDQAEAVRALLLQAGFTQVTTRSDLGDRPRCSGGRRAVRAPSDA